MEKLLIVIDMQNDFITGSLGSPQAQAILPNVKANIERCRCRLAFPVNEYIMRSIDHVRYRAYRM